MPFFAHKADQNIRVIDYFLLTRRTKKKTHNPPHRLSVFVCLPCFRPDTKIFLRSFPDPGDKQNLIPIKLPLAVSLPFAGSNLLPLESRRRSATFKIHFVIIEFLFPSFHTSLRTERTEESLIHQPFALKHPDRKKKCARMCTGVLCGNVAHTRAPPQTPTGLCAKTVKNPPSVSVTSSCLRRSQHRRQRRRRRRAARIGSITHSKQQTHFTCEPH